MKAIITSKNTSNALQVDGEVVANLEAVTVSGGKICTPVTVRCWMGRSRSASRVYACVWIHGRGYSLSGKGMAGGYGYCKKSAAIGAAFGSAGVRLSESIQGVGMSAVREAMVATCRALGYRGQVEVVGFTL
jgi:hypothetical protein